jgi:hypothetical protein
MMTFCSFIGEGLVSHAEDEGTISISKQQPINDMLLVHETFLSRFSAIEEFLEKYPICDIAPKTIEEHVDHQVMVSMFLQEIL